MENGQVEGVVQVWGWSHEQASKTSTAHLNVVRIELPTETTGFWTDQLQNCSYFWQWHNQPKAYD